MGRKLYIFAAAVIAALNFFNKTCAYENISDRKSPLVPMLALNGKPSQAQLDLWLADFKKAGIESFLIYGRTGCEIEYMSENWMDVCDFLVRRAGDLDMDVYLYDEFDWPSGTAKKRVMRDKPDCSLKYLEAKRNPSGNVDFRVRTNPNMADLFSAEAVDYFIGLTHEKYYKRFPDAFGKTVKAVFTDEPSVSYYGSEADKNALKIPYFNGIEEEYFRRVGRNLRDDITSGWDSNVQPWKETILRIISKRFSENYSGKLADWCAEHRIKLTGHLMSETYSKNALWTCGHPLRALSKFQLPGMDEISTATAMSPRYDEVRKMMARNVEWLTLHTVMYAAEKNGNRGALGELFALGPCDTPFGIYRREIWQVAAFGVDTYVLAISQLDLRVRLSDDPYLTYFMSTYMNSWTPNQSWFYDLKNFSEDAKTAAYFAKKDRFCEIAVRYKYDDKSDLVGLLRQIACAQLSSKLLLDGEKSDASIIATIDSKGCVYEEVSGKHFEKISDFVAWAESVSGGKVSVRNADGSKAPDVFVREFEDGSYIILNYGQSRNLAVLSPSGKKTVNLEEFGVCFFDALGNVRDTALRRPAGKVKSVQGVDARSPVVRMLGQNSMRPLFLNSKQFAFKTENDIELIFSVRKYGNTCKISLDGEVLDGNNAGAILPGFSGLYNAVKRQVKAGNHILELQGDAAEFSYLPLAVISGNFSRIGNVLKEYSGDGKGLDGAFGKIEETRCIRIPENAGLIELQTAQVPSELFIDGKSLGTKLWSPHIWKIPPDCRGREAEIKIVRKPSFGRIFGREIFFTKKDNNYLYRPYSADSDFLPVCGVIFHLDAD